MDFYLSALAGGGRVHFPLPPEQVVAQTGARMITVETIALGELTWPRGVKPAQISWEGLLPGQGHQNLPGLVDWQPPRVILDQLQRWRNDGTKLQLLITETPLNLPVYVQDLQHTWKGGHGDGWYQITLVAAREVRALTDAEAKVASAGTGASSGGSAGASASGSRARPAPPPPKTYTVRPGDTLWAIAKKTLGDGSRWRDLYTANKAVIGPDANKLRPGQVLRIPA